MCLSMDEWIKKMSHTHTHTHTHTERERERERENGILFSHKKNEILISVKAWMAWRALQYMKCQRKANNR